MSLVMKRKMEDMNNNLNFGCDGMLVKKSRSSGVLKCNMKNEDVKTKVFQILKLLSCHIFATPFLRMEKDLVDNRHHRYLDDVLKKVEQNKYENTQQVFDDLNDILDETIRTKKEANFMIIGRNKVGIQIMNYTQEDVEVMATQIRKKIYHAKETLFGQDREIQQVETNQDIDIIQPTGDADKIFETLQSRFPAVPAVILMTKALDISLSKSLDFNCIKQELEEANKKFQPKFKCYKFYPSRKHEFDKDKVNHSYIAGYQFHKMISKSSKAPVPIRTIMNISDAIESITYIENKDSTKSFEKQKDLFKQQRKVNENGNVEEMLLFHGTAVASLESILATNFIVDALPEQKNTQNERRKKTMMFGRGVYFSELPAISLMYGNGLLLCKVLPGNCEIFKPQGIPPPEISEDYDSREVLSNNSEGVIHVVKSPAQILPYCVIQLKKQSLSSQYIKPTQCVQPNPPTQCVQSNLPAQCLQASPQIPPHHNLDHAGWTVVKADQPKAYNKMTTIENTMKNFTSLTNSSDGQHTCSICQDPLSIEKVVSLSKCGHKFHSLCIQEVISHQTGQQHIQCPNCQTIHGIKTGNQPIDGEMSWRKNSENVPGYPDCGMIVIKYAMVDGVQTDCHPHPGKPFHAKGFPRTAILPDNQKGNLVLTLMIKAFRRRLIFTVGPSLTRGEDDCVTWNGIHHKTQLHDNGNGHGYPDLGYLDRVLEELKQKGIE